MIFILLKIRLFQFLRLSKDIGLIRGIVVLLMLFLTGIIIKSVLLNPQATKVVVAVISVLVFLIHLNRQDKHFIQLISGRSYLVCMCEYLLLVLPVTVIYAFQKNLLGTVAPVVLVCLVSFLNSGGLNFHLSGIIRFLINPFVSDKKSGINIAISVIQPLSFEWRSGIRQLIFVLVPLYVFLLTFSYVPNVGPIGFLIISLFTTSFYMQGESREFIEVFKTTPGGFLWKKIVVYCKYLSVLAFPFVLTTIIFNLSTWYMMIGAILFSFIVAGFTVLIKYALFHENSDLNKNSLILILHTFFLFLPFFWPVSIFSGVRFYKKAKQNLIPYFND